MFFDVHLFHSLISLRSPGSGFHAYFHPWASFSTKNSKCLVSWAGHRLTCSHHLRKLFGTLGDASKATSIDYWSTSILGGRSTLMAECRVPTEIIRFCKKGKGVKTIIANRGSLLKKNCLFKNIQHRTTSNHRHESRAISWLGFRALWEGGSTLSPAWASSGWINSPFAVSAWPPTEETSQMGLICPHTASSTHYTSIERADSGICMIF